MTAAEAGMRPANGWLGRVVNAFGEEGGPVDGKGPLSLDPSLYPYSNSRRPPMPAAASARSWDRCCSSQRMGILELPRLLKWAGPSAGPQAGAIIRIFTLLADGDDHNEPVAAALEGFFAQGKDDATTLAPHYRQLAAILTSSKKVEIETEN